MALKAANYDRGVQMDNSSTNNNNTTTTQRLRLLGGAKKVYCKTYRCLQRRYKAEKGIRVHHEMPLHVLLKINIYM